ncbi:MAG TPA: flagellar hook-associated protein FlgL [Terriglobales bacterium]|nr:flagellar hook-associated protein FlgL [Terriglobales bacterium]
MSIRVNPNPTPDLLAALAAVQQQVDTATIELSSGSRINKPSDDPAGAAQLAEIHDRGSQNDSFQKSISSITGAFQTADSTLSSVVTALERAISLGVQGANGTLSDSDRSIVAQELSGIQTQLISLANTSYQGQFLFSGTARTQPFVADSTASSGVRYNGNAGVNTATVGNGYQLQLNLPGSQVFSASGSDMFQSIQNLITSLRNNSGIDTAVAEVRKAFDYITAQRVFYGNALNQIDSQAAFLNSEKLDLGRQENTVAGADIASVASQLVNDQTARNATLAAIGRMPQDSLFDYLK